ncbi:MAG: glycoside hydrolase family protein [Armatimonadota bacterium]
MRSIKWTIPSPNPVIAPGQLNPPYDTRRAGAAHVLQVGDRYRMYYWGTDQDDFHHICLAETPVNEPNAWQGRGAVLGRQDGTEYNHFGPGFPHVVPVPGNTWLLYFCGWGKARPDGKLPNTTGVAASDDEGLTWRYASDAPVLPCDRPYDREGTGSVWVLYEDGLFRMYYTAIAEYFPRPEGVRTGHGDVIPGIGISYAVSRDGIAWEKPLDHRVIEPRGFATAPYEYIASKPCILREGGGYRAWVHTFGTAYRVRGLTSADGLAWEWQPGGIDGELGVGEPGAFDAEQRCYVSVVREGEEYRCWYTGNGFGGTGMGYAVGKRR